MPWNTVISWKSVILVIPWLTIILAALDFLKELIYFPYHHLEYLQAWENIFEFGLHISTFFFVLPYIMCQFKTEPHKLLSKDSKWLTGAISILFSWFNLPLYFKYYPWFGFYVTMFLEAM